MFEDLLDPPALETQSQLGKSKTSERQQAWGWASNTTRHGFS
jgi:hypothetical protein